MAICLYNCSQLSAVAEGGGGPEAGVGVRSDEGDEVGGGDGGGATEEGEGAAEKMPTKRSRSSAAPMTPVLHARGERGDGSKQGDESEAILRISVNHTVMGLSLLPPPTLPPTLWEESPLPPQSLTHRKSWPSCLAMPSAQGSPSVISRMLRARSGNTVTISVGGRQQMGGRRTGEGGKGSGTSVRASRQGRRGKGSGSCLRASRRLRSRGEGNPASLQN